MTLAKGAEAPRTSARNRVPGTVVRVEGGKNDHEVTLDIGNEKSLTATVTTKENAEAPGLPSASA